MKTLKLCVKTLALTIVLLMIGPTVCRAEEQAPAAVEANTIVENTIDTEKAAMWDIPEEERTDDNFGPGILLQQNNQKEDVTQPKVKEMPVADNTPETVEQPVPKKKRVKKERATTPKKIKKAEEPPVVHNIGNRVNRWGISLTQNQRDILARIVKKESGGESNLGQQAVVEVIFNRVVDGSFPNNVIGVLSARGQFSTWPMRNYKSATPTAKEFANIDAVLNGQTNIFPFRTVYFSRGAQNSKIQARIGGHTFCNK